jgi:hypothetical protein
MNWIVNVTQVLGPALIIGLLMIVISYVIYGNEDIQTVQKIFDKMQQQKDISKIYVNMYENGMKSVKFKVTFARALALTLCSAIVLYIFKEYSQGMLEGLGNVAEGVKMYGGNAPF